MIDFGWRVVGRKTILVALLCLVNATPVIAKELYLTARRDFGSNEQPEIELNYRSPAPIHLRVLKPKDMRQFISSQLDIRRSWKEPPVVLNTGRFLMRGLNERNPSLSWLRNSTDGSMRVSLKDRFGGAENSDGSTSFVEGPKKFISIPDNFTVADEVTIYPESSDQSLAFDVPGFNWWFGHYGGSLKIKNVQLPKQEPGFYVVQAIQGMMEGQVVLVVNDLMALLQQTEGEVVVRASDRAGKPLANASVALRNLNQKWVAESKTNDKGEARFADVTDTELVAVVNRDGAGTAVIDTEFFPAHATYPDVYLYSDRPIYKPGDKIFYKGILRQSESGLSRILRNWLKKDTKVRVKLVSVDDNSSAITKVVSVSDFGTFHGELAVPEEVAGLFRIEAELGGEKHHGEVRVKEYEKPKFYLTVDSDQETLKPGETLRAKVKIRRFAGGVPEGVSLKAELFRQRYDGPQWVEDAGMAETGSEVTYYWDPAKQVSTAIPVPVMTQNDLSFNLKGEIEIEMNVPKSLPGDPNYDYKFSLRLYADNRDGDFASGSKTFLDMRTPFVAQARMTSVMATPSQPATLQVRSVSPSGKPVGGIDGKVTWMRRGYKKEERSAGTQPFKTNAQGRIDVPVPTGDPGRYRAVVEMSASDGTKTTAEASILVATDRPGEAVVDVPHLSLHVAKAKWAVGETVKVLALLPEKWGEGGSDEGRLYVTVAGKEIYNRRVVEVDGQTGLIPIPVESEFGTSFYVLVSYPHPQEGWVERKLSLQVPQTDKALNLGMRFADENVTPGSEQTVFINLQDAAGQGVAGEVSISVVDKAVYSVQPEFRPPLLPFFYPPQRLNVMSFLSHRFQSYGYGEELARLFRADPFFAAPKDEEEQTTERDTGYWNATIVTNDAGQAQVTFRLPANQTIWTVTGIAVDKNGRFGENRQDFKANRDVSLIASHPLFIREGDRARVRLTVASSGKASGDFDVTAEPAGDLKRTGKDFDFKGAVKPNGERSKSMIVALGETAQDRVTMAASLKHAGKVTAYEYNMRAKSGWVRFPQYLSLNRDGEQGFTVGEGGRVSSIQLTAAYGLTGTLVPASKWLVRYPYGCVEQVTNATVPNLVFQQLFESSQADLDNTTAGIDQGKVVNWIRGKITEVGERFNLFQKPGITLNAKQQELVDNATTFGRAGLARLGQYQTESGSFAWFSGDVGGDVDMSLYVLMSLSSLDELPVVDGLDLVKGLRWVQSRKIGETSPRAILATYVDARLTKLGLKEGPPSNAGARIRFLAEKAAGATVLEQALVLLAADAYGFSRKAEFQDALNPLVANMAKAVMALGNQAKLQPKVWTPQQSRWSSYPGRLASTAAIAGRALAAYGAAKPEHVKTLTDFLLASFNGGHFGSTFETGQALIHSQWLFRQEMQSLRSAGEPKMLVNGEAVQVKAEQQIGGWSLTYSGKAIGKGRHTVALSDWRQVKKSSVRLDREAPLDVVKSSGKTWKVQKKFYRLNPRNGDRTEVKNGRYKIGDLIYVELTFLAVSEEQPWWASHYHLLVDDIPAGMTVVEEDRVYQTAPFNLPLRGKVASRREVHADHIRYFFRSKRGWMDRGNKVGYVMRAQYAGDFAAGVTRLEDVYDEENFALRGHGRVRVASAR